MKQPLHLPDQQPGEEIVFVLHRFGATFSGRVIQFFFIALLPIAAALVFRSFVSDIFGAHGVPGMLLAMAVSLYYLFAGVTVFRAWVVFSLDAWVATTKRILNIEQKGLFSRVVSELPLDKIEDVTVMVHGVIPTLLHYGDLRIQTAGEEEHFLFDNVPNPQKVAQQIMALHDQVERKVVPQAPQQQNNVSAQENVAPEKK